MSAPGDAGRLRDRPTPTQIEAKIEATREELGRHSGRAPPTGSTSRAAPRRTPLRARDTAVETYRESPPAVLGGREQP